MTAFLVGLVVIVLMTLVAIVGSLLFPLLLLMGLFLRFFLAIFIALLFIWAIGKMTLVAIAYLQKRNP